MTALMLTAEELVRLTGKRQAAKQAEYCKRNGIRYRMNDAGEVIVARAIGERFLGVEPVGEVRHELDYRAMERIGILPGRGEAKTGR